MKLTVPSVAFLLSLPLAANAQLIRCTSADGRSSTLQRGKCASATDVQTPVVAAKPIAAKPVAPPLAPPAAPPVVAKAPAKPQAPKMIGPKPVPPKATHGKPPPQCRFYPDDVDTRPLRII